MVLVKINGIRKNERSRTLTNKSAKKIQTRTRNEPIGRILKDVAVIIKFIYGRRQSLRGT